MTTDEPDDDETKQYDWMIPLRLAAPGAVNEQIIDELGLVPVVEAAEWCYAVRSAGRHLSPDAVAWDPYSRWLRTAHGLAGSVGESLAVCIGCEIELALLRAARPRSAEIGGRFFSIAASHEIIGIGHRLVNLAQRAFSARPDYRALLRSSSDQMLAASASYDHPRSGDRAAWLSLNATTARSMRSALCDVEHPSVRAVLAELTALAISDEWVTLNEVRGEVFHRSRPESSVASGLDGESGYSSPILDRSGRAVGMSVGGLQRYAGGDERWKEEAAATRAALDRIAAAAKNTTTAFLAAIEPLSGGERRAEVESSGRIRPHHQVAGRRWSDERCTCCAAQT